jgi:hypothetical protein
VPQILRKIRITHSQKQQMEIIETRAEINEMEPKNGTIKK